MMALLHETDGANPYAELALGPDKQLYGVTRFGGIHGTRTIFRVSAGAALETLHSRWFGDAEPWGG
jgi:uncharacterized repeat protein (TIGR03803 family)